LHIVGSRFMTDMGGLRKHIKKTYVFMWAAGLALMGAPFITTGFWSKDAVFAAVYESGNEWALPIFTIAVLTAVITAFYTTRMIGMVFFGPKSKHIKKMESEGHHIHDAPKSMWIPYGILATLTIGIGIIGLSAEEGSEDMTIHGKRIPKGDLVLLSLTAANIDPQKFTYPETLNISREENNHLAFGAGIHHCLGAPLARLEGQIALGTLLQRLPNLRLAIKPDQLNYNHSKIRSLVNLPVVF